MKVHNVKSWVEYFAMVVAGVKTFELRKNDRDYKVGDIVELEEFRPHVGTYTGRKQKIEITYLIDGSDNVGMDGLRRGFCIFSFRKIGEVEQTG